MDNIIKGWFPSICNEQNDPIYCNFITLLIYTIIFTIVGIIIRIVYRLITNSASKQKGN
jgi:hypothetical protein